MIRVLIDGGIFSWYPHGGIARIYREILPRIVRGADGIEFFVLCDERALPNLPDGPGIQPLVFRKIGLRPSRIFSVLDDWRFAKFNAMIQNFEANIFHSAYYSRPPRAGMKTVAMVYDLIDHQFPMLQPNGKDFVAKQANVLCAADRVISISESTRISAIAAFGLDPAKVSTVALGASDVFTPLTPRERHVFKSQFTSDRPFFLFVGSAGSYKNAGTLLRAFGAIAKLTQHVLVLAGHSMLPLEPWMVDLAIQLRIEERVVVMNRPSDELLRQAYGSADAFVFPSLQEGFGIPLVEAMRCDCNILASNLPVFREICGDAANYFDPHSPEEIARCLLEHAGVGGQEMQSKRSERQALFSWDRCAREVSDVYKSLVMHTR